MLQVLVKSFLVCYILSFSLCSQDLCERRLSIVFQGIDWSDSVFILRCLSGNLEISSQKNEIKILRKWEKISLPSGVVCRSNPVAANRVNNKTLIFFQDTNAQIYMGDAKFDDKSITIGSWQQVGGDLPFTKGTKTNGFDNVVVKEFRSRVYVFARSLSNVSNLYWTAVDNDLSYSKWLLLGGSSVSLMTDFSVAYNSFTELLEAFTVGTDGFLYRSWQLSFGKWSAWDKTGYNGPKSTHAPVVHSMGTNLFNGRLNVFVHGTDGNLHHIWQTTCDNVPNPWGWCTWSTWNTISGDIPINLNYPNNSITAGNNLHLGIEVFVVDGEGQLYKTWQMQRHSGYSEWQFVQALEEYKMVSLPTIVNDKSGWWSAYGMDSDGNVIVVQQSRQFSVSPTSMNSGSELTVSWSMPIDEASSSDWIGVYSNGARNEDYVDYIYVGGSQNPLSEVITKGTVSFFTYLPKGTYEVRYLVDRRFVAATGTGLTISKDSSDVEWVQIFKGIFIGLNLTAVDIESCVKDATDIPKKFDDSFAAFKDRSIYKGLSLFGLAIGDIVKGMIDCGVETAITGRIKTFVEDLVNCASAGSCSHFFIDIVKELLVLYENVYEIYGDIRGASNCFQIKAFAQGGVNVGRVIGACIS